MLDAVADGYRELDALLPKPGPTVLLSASAASLPDLAGRLRRAGHTVHGLDHDAAARGALGAIDALIQDDGELRFVLRLDAAPPLVVDAEPEPEPESEPDPSVDAPPLRLAIEGRGEHLIVTAIDGAVRRGDQLLAAGSTLAVGDRLVLPSGFALRVEPASGSGSSGAEVEDADGA